MPKVLVVGSGWAASSFVKYLDKDKYNTTVISPSPFFIYTPYLIKSIFYNLETNYDIRKLGNITYIKNKVVDVDFNNNKLILSDKSLHDYDYVVFAHGCEINTFNISGVRENCFFIKNNDDVKIIRNKFKNLNKESNIAVIGCSLTGTELIGNLLDNNFKNHNIYAIDGLDSPLKNFDTKISDLTTKLWREKNINMNFNNFVKKIDKEQIYFNDKTIKYDLAFWCGGVKKSPFSDIINKKLNLNCKFGIPVNKFLKIENTTNSYAIGDCAYTTHPPTAQVSYQQGKYLANYFNNDFNGEKFNYHHLGKISYLGDRVGVFENKYYSGGGKLVGYLNNFIHVFNGINYDHVKTLFKTTFFNKDKYNN